MITVSLPLQLGRGENNREHHFVRHRRVAAEKEAVIWVLGPKPRPRPPCTFWLTRISPSHRPVDGDNLQGALKATRDAIAQWMRVDDGDPQVQYRYQQEHGPWGVRIEWQEQAP